MELFNDEVPGDTVWAVVTTMGDHTHRYVDWFLTAEASSEEFRHMVAFHKAHSGGTAQRWKLTLPRRRMERTDVTLWVEEKLLLQDPDGTTQLLDVSSQKIN